MTANGNTAYVTGTGYTCTCGTWVAYGTSHACMNGLAAQSWPVPDGSSYRVDVQPGGEWKCAACGQQAYGYHTCFGPSLVTAAEPAAETRPESPLAALVADLRALLARAQSFLADRKL